jgi:diacylglycerol kinase family enzyme
MIALPPHIHEAARNGPLFIVINSGSGAKNTDDEQAVMRSVFERGGREFEFLTVNSPAQLGAVCARAVALATERRGVVVAAGGDGTINAVASAVLPSSRPFGVLPQGTFNYFGRDNAIAQDTEAAANALLGASICPVAVGQVNGRVFLVNASLGLYPQLLEDREAFKQQFGRSRLVALLSSVRTLLRDRGQLRLEIERGGQTRLVRTPTLFVGNNRLQLSQVGIAERELAAIERGSLAGVVVKPIATWALLTLLARGMIGRLGEAEQIESFSFRTLKVSLRGKRRVKVATDGEIVWMNTPLIFKVADQPLLLMRPAKADRVEIA